MQKKMAVSYFVKQPFLYGKKNNSKKKALQKQGF